MEERGPVRVLVLVGDENANMSRLKRMKVIDSLFIFGFVFIGIPIIGLATVFVEIFRGVL